MHQLAILYRGLQLFAHNAHNMAKGQTFMQDHAHFGELYEAYEDAYDSVVERIIGLGEEPDLNDITEKACDISCSKTPDSNDAAFRTILGTEKLILKEIAKDMKDASDGTQNLLQDLADKGEMRIYKIQRRLK